MADDELEAVAAIYCQPGEISVSHGMYCITTNLKHYAYPPPPVDLFVWKIACSEQHSKFILFASQTAVSLSNWHVRY